MNKANKHVKIFLCIVTLLVLLFVISISKFQQLVNESAAIADERCVKVEPLVKEKQILFHNIRAILTASDDAKDYVRELNKYTTVANKYVDEEQKWLSKERLFLDSWEYIFFTPSYIKEQMQLQYEIRQAEVEGQIAINKMLTASDGSNTDVLSKTVIEENEKAKELTKQLVMLQEKNHNRFEIRSFLVTIPNSSCN